MKTFTIPLENKEKVEERLSFLARKSEKLGSNPITFSFGDPYGVEGVGGGAARTRYYVDVEVDGEAPSLNGWLFVGTLQHKDGGNILRSAPNTVIPEYFRDVAPGCDHCNVNRYRRDTYIVGNIVTGEYKQVGSGCIRDFLGHSDPKWIVQFFEILQDIEDEFNGSWGIADRNIICTREVVEAAFAIVDMFGWTPKYMADEGYIPTASRVITVMYGWSDWKVQQEYEGFEITKDVVERANMALDWIKDQPNDNNYIANLKVACSQEMIERRDVGIVCSLVAAYNRHINEEEEKAKEVERKKDSNWVGEVGRRIELEVECTGLRLFENQYRVTYFHSFADAEGNQIIWWGSKVIAEKGEKIRMKATVKEHSEYNGVKQTVVTRCTLI